MITLPAIDFIPQTIAKGRNVHDGYMRGWGLQFSDLHHQIFHDDHYQHCLQYAKGRTVQGEACRMNLYLLVRFFLAKLPFGHIVEFGSYLGGSALFMAAAAKTLLPGVKVFAFDTYQGMPKTDHTVDMHGEGDFGDTDLGKLREYASSSGLDNIEFIQGLFSDTWPDSASKIQSIALNHIDCDIRSSVAYAYECTKDSMVQGGYIVFDDALVASCIGATEAVEELLIRRDGLHSEQVYPHMLFRAGLK